MDPVKQIADAVLYEGYLLWPYRRSALKNQRRWTFGGVYPEAHSRLHPDDRSVMRTECLLEGGDPADVEVTVRFLHVVRVGDWEEAVERELGPGAIAVAAGRDGGRSWEALEGEVAVRAERLADGLSRLTVEIANRTPWEAGSRQEVLRRTFCSTHTVLRTSSGGFVSLTDPPEPLRDAANRCRNEGTWPVLVGEAGSRDTLLSSPIILEDHPRIAPESPGDLFDGGEVDQLLTLSILAMTDEEKADMRDADPRTREILERTEALSEEQLMALHGAIREFGLERR
jgi:hydrogenase maturation protease